MTIHITPEHERIIEHAVHSGAYRDAQEVISAALESLAEDLVAQAVAESREPVPRPSLGEAIAQLKSFGKTHGLSLGGMTLRQMRQEARP